MKIVRYSAAIICLALLLLVPSCKPSTTAPAVGNWVRQGDFLGVPRSGAFSFVIDDIAYVGGGYYGGVVGNSTLTYVTDVYAFNVQTGNWKKLKPFPGTPRERSVSFSVNGKGYVGTGYNRDLDPSLSIMADFWQYDPAADEWTQVADFPGGARYNAVGFSDGTYGYAGTGFDGTFYNDFYRYDATNNTWTPIQISGQKRQQATTFEIDGKIYLLSGFNNNAPVLDFVRFDPLQPDNAQWQTITPLVTDAQYANFKIAVSRGDAVAFSLDGKGYIATGTSGGARSDVYQFDPTGTGTWTQMTAFERSPRSQAISFVVAGRIFVGLGTVAAGGTSGSRFDNMEEFKPYDPYNAND